MKFSDRIEFDVEVILVNHLMKYQGSVPVRMGIEDGGLRVLGELNVSSAMGVGFETLPLDQFRAACNVGIEPRLRAEKPNGQWELAFDGPARERTLEILECDHSWYVGKHGIPRDRFACEHCGAENRMADA